MGPRVWGIGFRASGFEDLVFARKSGAQGLWSKLHIFLNVGYSSNARKMALD